MTIIGGTKKKKCQAKFFSSLSDWWNDGKRAG